MQKILEKINHHESYQNCVQEREFLAHWGGGCSLDIGATIEQNVYRKILFSRGRDNKTSTCNGHFKVYHLLHNVPRFNNPSGIFDNDQYHYRIYTKCSGGVDLDAYWVKIAMQAGVRSMDGGAEVNSVAQLIEKGGNI